MFQRGSQCDRISRPGVSQAVEKTVDFSATRSSFSRIGTIALRIAPIPMASSLELEQYRKRNYRTVALCQAARTVLVLIELSPRRRSEVQWTEEKHPS